MENERDFKEEDISLFPSSIEGSSTLTLFPTNERTNLNSYYEYKPTKRPTMIPSLLPTPYGEIGIQWWYYTHAYMSLQWDSNELSITSTIDILNIAFYKVLNEMMFHSLSVGINSQVRLGNLAITRKLIINEHSNDESNNHENNGDNVYSDDLTWDDYTLEVWSITAGSSEQVYEVLEILQKDQTMFIDLIRQEGITSAKSIFLHGIQSTTTEVVPDVLQSSISSISDPERIIWIILLTLLLFFIGVLGIVEVRRRCIENKTSKSSYNHQDIHPKTIAALCCPCLSPPSSPSISLSTINSHHHDHHDQNKLKKKKYIKTNISDDIIEENDVNTNLDISNRSEIELNNNNNSNINETNKMSLLITI